MQKKASTVLPILLTCFFFLTIIFVVAARSTSVGIFFYTSKNTTPDILWSIDGKININTATVSMLDELPGIGTKLASRIVEYREKHGPFRDVYQLTEVTGLGSETLDMIIDYITTGDIK